MTRGNPKRHQQVLVFLGEKDLHCLAYTLTTDQPSEHIQQKWLQILGAAKLTRVGNAAE